MRNRLVLSGLCCWLAVLIGCTPDRPFKPGTDNPEWAFDRPDYYEPIEDPVPFIKGTDGQPDIHYTNQRVVFIKRPDYPEPREAPRPAVFTTKDNGQTWKKEGHFGLEQTYFEIVLPPKDGTYGVCLIGVYRTDLAPANLQIQKVYVLDSQAPMVEMTVNPEEGPYWVGQRLELTWKVSDPNLGAQPALLQSRIVDRDGTFVWKDQKSGLDATGTIAVMAEQLPRTARGLQFRIKAADQMGNVGAGYTPLLTLMNSAPTTTKAATSAVFAPPPRRQLQPKSTARQSQDEPATTTVIVPRARAKTLRSQQTTSPGTSTDNMPPWSWDERAAAAAPVPETEPETQLIATSAGQQEQSEPDTEMAELERLLANVSSPVYRGRVQKMPQPEAAVQPPPAIAAAPPAEVAPQKPMISRTLTPVQPAVPEPVSTVPEPIAVQPEPEPVQAPPIEVVVRPVMASPEQPAEPAVAVKSPAEPLALATPEPAPVAEPIAMATGEPEAIIDIAPRSEPSEPMPSIAAVPAETEHIAVLPEPRVLVPVEPAVGPGPIVTVRPPSQPGMEPKATEPAPTATVPAVRTVALSSGTNRMAKPWERLGNPTAAATNFYTYAPTLSNY